MASANSPITTEGRLITAAVLIICSANSKNSPVPAVPPISFGTCNLRISHGNGNRYRHNDDSCQDIFCQILLIIMSYGLCQFHTNHHTFPFYLLYQPLNQNNQNQYRQNKLKIRFQIFCNLNAFSSICFFHIVIKAPSPFCHTKQQINKRTKRQ